MNHMVNAIKKSKAGWKILYGHHPWRSVYGHGHADEELETYKRMALVAGWSEWELGIKKKKTKSSSSSKGVYEFN